MGDNNENSNTCAVLAPDLCRLYAEAVGPFELPIAEASDAEAEDNRRQFARELHMRCSSLPLPANLVAGAKNKSPKTAAGKS
jgi:hypothetical protein